MLAEERTRGQGLAPEALATFLEYIGRNLPYKLCSLVAKVSMDNEPSIRLFRGRLGFVERNRCNVFKQIEFIPPPECYDPETDYSSAHGGKFRNIASSTAQWIVQQMATKRFEFQPSHWSYEEADLNLWRGSLS
ncbi:hypothetical protein D915_002725 [Fasciola hepatica]|uniref:Uncharacterized protein n=1 Tax=Fasciola hepatica TaxID=6192 RepID=A0A2H1CKR8_FASHE|nr:hypothetical protein D915_002725 [Fasciola hepatica]